jgi:DNA-binding response OmpR family regulator
MSRVLYVEDECLLQLDGEASLQAAGYDVVLASDGESASAFLLEDGAPLDGLISDIDLPGRVQGWQIAALARRLRRDLPVIYVTGQAHVDFLEMGVRDSIMLPKPFAWSRLLTCLSVLIDSPRPNARGGPSTPTTARQPRRQRPF